MLGEQHGTSYIVMENAKVNLELVRHRPYCLQILNLRGAPVNQE